MCNLDWEFAVVESPEVNAFVVPGGKVVVYTGAGAPVLFVWAACTHAMVSARAPVACAVQRLQLQDSCVLPPKPLTPKPLRL